MGLFAYVCSTGCVAGVVYVGSGNPRVSHFVTSSVAVPCLLLLSFAVLDHLVASSTEHQLCAAGDASAQLHVVAMSVFGTLTVVFVYQRLVLSGLARLTSLYSLVMQAMVLAAHWRMHAHGVTVWHTWYGTALWPARLNVLVHATTALLLSLAAIPRVTEVWSVQHIVRRAVDAYVVVLGALVGVLQVWTQRRPTHDPRCDHSHARSTRAARSCRRSGPWSGVACCMRLH
jgi:hypothetical protein